MPPLMGLGEYRYRSGRRRFLCPLQITDHLMQALGPGVLTPISEKPHIHSMLNPTSISWGSPPRMLGCVRMSRSSRACLLILILGVQRSILLGCVYVSTLTYLTIREHSLHHDSLACSSTLYVQLEELYCA